MQPKCISTERAILGEGPLWDDATGCLYWLDIKGKRLYRHTPGQDNMARWELPLRVGSVALPGDAWMKPSSDARCPILLAGTERGFAWLQLDADKTRIQMIAAPEHHLPGNRFNDGKMGADGRFYAGTMDDTEQQATGSLYALSADLGLTRLDTGYMVSNGPAFSPAGDLVYHNDSGRQIIYRFRLEEDGELRDKTVFRQFAGDEGYPDGMTTDRAGNLYVAMWDGWRIEIIDPDGVTLERIEFPVARVTSCTFAGSNEGRLYATSASIGVEPEEQPLAGGLFLIDL